MKVAVVGLGAAGLRAAMLLAEQGADLELYEARDRLGGRLHTPDLPGGVRYDAGGEWLDSDHHRALDLCAHLGLPAEPTGFWPGQVVFRRGRSTEDLLWADALEDDLRVEAAAREQCRNLVNPPWRNARFASLDCKTLDEFLVEHCRSERGLWWLRSKSRSDEGEDPEQISLLGWLCGTLHTLDREPAAMSAFRIPGGAQGLCERMAGGLPHARLGWKLLRVRCELDGVYLEFDEGTTTAERVVLTLPPPALERVVFDPPMHVTKRCAIEACGMSRAIKIAWEFDRAWWTDEGWNGRMLCDGAIQQTWAAGQGSAPVLCAYIGGEQAMQWASNPHAVLHSFRELERIAPAAQGRFVRGWLHNWPHDPLAGGAFSHLPPRYALEHMEHIAPPDQRVHFAGEHTSDWTGFIEGALESAERVAKEVMDA